MKSAYTIDWILSLKGSNDVDAKAAAKASKKARQKEKRCVTFQSLDGVGRGGSVPACKNSTTNKNRAHGPPEPLEGISHHA